MVNLERPNFIERSPATIEAAAIALYQQVLDKTLYPGQAERLLLNALVYRETVTRIGIQDAAEQNLVNYARGINLDQLGVLLAVTRLPEAAAQVTIQFLRAAGPLPQLIPAGTRVAIQGGEVAFATLADATIPANQATVTAIAQATITGEVGNGFAPGQITEMLDTIIGVSATNTTTSNGGATVESDDRYRERIKLAPNQFSVAGSSGAYRFWALTADTTITDVAITNPVGGQVNVYPLTTTGLPSAEVKTAVLAVLDDDSVRPLTDSVSVLDPVEVSYDITANIVLYSSADSAMLTAQLDAAAAAFVATQDARLGQDIVRSQIIAALSVDGVYSVTLSAPAADVVVAPEEWSHNGTVTINITGTNDG